MIDEIREARRKAQCCRELSVPLSAFNGTDGHDVNAILFVGGPQAGKFEFQIDEIQLQ